MPDKPDRFTRDELAFMQDGVLFDRKEEITKRIQALLFGLQAGLKPRLRPGDFLAPEGTDFDCGQVVRGERFHRRPYAYLDYPKYFSRQGMFTYRSFFWWGWDFVFAFLLAGPHMDFYRENLIRHLDRLRKRDFYLSLAPDPWEWRKSSPHTLPIAGRSPEEIRRLIGGQAYLKVQYFVGLEDPAWKRGGIVKKGLEVFESLRCIVAR